MPGAYAPSGGGVRACAPSARDAQSTRRQIGTHACAPLRPQRRALTSRRRGPEGGHRRGPSRGGMPARARVLRSAFANAGKSRTAACAANEVSERLHRELWRQGAPDRYACEEAGACVCACACACVCACVYAGVQAGKTRALSSALRAMPQLAPYTHTRTHARTHTQTDTHACMHACTHARAHTHTYV